MFTYDNELESLYTARVIHLKAGKSERFQVQESMILFNISGYLQLKTEGQSETDIKEHEMVFVHAGFSCTITAVDKAQVMILCFPEVIPLCNRFVPEVLEHKKYTCETLFYTLPRKKYIDMWTGAMLLLVSEMSDLQSLIKTKTQELFLLLKICYPTEDLISFLCPVFSYNYEFTLFILNNYYKVKTVAELVELSSLSLSGFEKEFRKVFGTSPYRWMLGKKMKKLHYEISNTDKLFKVIAEEYGFVSLSQLGDFCRKHFGSSPRDIRNKRGKG